MKIELKLIGDLANRYYGEEGPQYATHKSGAFDLRACIDQTLTILPGEQVMIPTGIAIHLGNVEGMYAAVAMPRSGRGSRDGLVLGNTIGLIDADYQGEVMICAWARPTSGHVNIANGRFGGGPIHIEPGERIAQMMIVPVAQVSFAVVPEFTEKTARGAGGFGSTGHA